MTTETQSTGQDTTNGGEQTTTDQTTGSTSTATDTTSTDTTSTATGEQGTTKTDGEQTQQGEITYDFTMPDGVQLDPTAVTELTTMAKEHGLTKDVAQKVVDIGTKMAQRQIEAHVAQVKAWVGEVTSDSEIGGDKLDANLALAKGVLDTFGNDKLRQELDRTGMGNHPELVRLMVKIGQKISPDTFVAGNRSPSGEKDPAKVMFPNMN